MPTKRGEREMARKPQFTRTKTETTFSAILLGLENGKPVVKDTKEITVGFPVTEDNAKVAKVIRQMAGRNYQFGHVLTITEKTYSMPLQEYFERATVVSTTKFDSVEAYKNRENQEDGGEA